MGQLSITIVENVRLAGGVERPDSRSLEGQWHRERAEHTLGGHALGIIGQALLTQHVIDQEHLAGQAGVHTRSIPTLVLQFVGIQSHLPVIGSRERLLCPDQRDRSCLHAGHPVAVDSIADDPLAVAISANGLTRQMVMNGIARSIQIM
jgi:hypothetical protein